MQQNTTPTIKYETHVVGDIEQAQPETVDSVAREMLVALKVALSVLDDAKGNINPERGFADKLEREISDAAAVVRAAISKAEGRADD